MVEELGEREKSGERLKEAIINENCNGRRRKE
jgi:hypothetical protein